MKLQIIKRGPEGGDCTRINELYNPRLSVKETTDIIINDNLNGNEWGEVKLYVKEGDETYTVVIIEYRRDKNIVTSNYEKVMNKYGHLPIRKILWHGGWSNANYIMCVEVLDNKPMTAKEMFEQLGYEYDGTNDDKTVNVACYKEEVDVDGYESWYSIVFWVDDHTVSCDSNYEGMCVDIPTFKAIYQQLIELGWL